MNDIDKIKEKLTAQRLRNEAQRVWDMISKNYKIRCLNILFF